MSSSAKLGTADELTNLTGLYSTWAAAAQRVCVAPDSLHVVYLSV